MLSENAPKLEMSRMVVDDGPITAETVRKVYQQERDREIEPVPQIALPPDLDHEWEAADDFLLGQSFWSPGMCAHRDEAGELCRVHLLTWRHPHAK